jgi:hypothetical protein
VIHRLARIHRTPRRRKRVARTVSPETRLWVSSSSKAASAAICKVHRLLSYPNSLGERWSIPSELRRSSGRRPRGSFWGARIWPREHPGLWLKSWMASRTVCCPHPGLLAILGAYSPLELARSIWERRKVKASLERREAWRASCSSSENEPTEIGIFMALTITRNTKPILKLH